MRGYTMPAFTFEKLSPPAADTAAPAVEQKPRGRVIQMLDRFVERRIQRTLGDQPHTIDPQDDGR
jgi:hypothetical protein